MDSQQAQPAQDGGVKRGPLEDLGREELIRKCKGLLGLAQKAKQAKDEFAEENKKLKENLNKFETQKEADKKSLMAMKEMVDSLTESKLSQTSEIADLHSKLAKYEKEIKILTEGKEQLTELSIENESLKRQIQRLSDENEELLTNLDSMEKKLDQVNQFGMQQQKDLILLEEATAKWEMLEASLRNKLEVSSEEITALKEQISKLEEEKCSMVILSEKHNDCDIHLDRLKKENEDLQKQIESLNSKLKDQDSREGEANIEALQKKSMYYEEICAKQAEELDGLRKSTEIQSSRAQNIKVKLTEVTMKLRKLKKSKQVLADAVQEYYVSIPTWQKEMQKASKLLCMQITSLGTAKRDLEQKVNLLETELRSMTANSIFYEKRLVDLIHCCNRVLIEESENPIKEHIGGKHSIELKDIGLNTETKPDELEDKTKELEKALLKAQAEYEQSYKHLSTMQEDFNKQTISLETAESELKSVKDSLISEKIRREELEMEYNQIKNDLRCAAEENKNLLNQLEASKENIDRLQATLCASEERHADLLSEMRELNEALKGRGDVISRQQDRIAELEKESQIAKDNISQAEESITQKESLIAVKESEIKKMSKEINEARDEVANLSHQARESEKLIKTLSEEVTSMRDRVYDTQSEVLSTSTVSKAEESMRMREVDESFEEKYNKLRTLAIKLKRKVQEQANQIAILENDNKKNFEEKNEIKTKLGTINVQVKNLQALQNENDKLLDEIEKVRKEKDNAEKQIKELSEKIQAISAGIPSDNTIQEYQNQIKLFKQEKESFNLVRREWENERDMLKTDLTTKERELNTIRQQNEKIKAELEKCKAAGKQSSVLNLEIEAYEKSLNDTTENLKIKEALIKDFQESLKIKDEFIESNKKEIKLLEESLESEKGHSLELKQQIDIQQTKYKESEHEKCKLRERLQDLTSECEELKSQVDELRLELSELTRAKEHLSKTFQKEKEDLYRQVVNMEENVATLTAKLKATECELEDVRTEHANYKVRAQSVLRQNQNKETSRERELEEEITVMRSTIEKLNLEVAKSKEAFLFNEKKVEDLRQDNERIQKRCKELMELLEECRLQNESILEDNRKQSLEYQESLKAHRLQIDAINSCYKKQVEELEEKHANELEELKKAGKEIKLVSRMAPFGGPKSPDEQKIDLILMEREDAEGSETSVPVPRRRISSTRSKHDLIPLDELLNSSLDENRDEDRCESPSLELQITKEKLQVQESRVRHLTSLLSETEQDLAKLTQLNEVLKEEVRRHERAVEREKHIQNSEYLKNIVFKFLTLHSGDERIRLVPVLNTILKLSPDETQTLQNVAKGSDVIQRGWGSYLPIWSNHQ